MRALNRNKVGFFYALYVSETDAVDANGKKTGSKTKTYGAPVFMKANISPDKGEADIEPFGKDLDYSRVIYVNGTNCPITEESLLWIYKGMTSETDVTKLQSNYAVVGVAESLNETRYAIRQKGIDRRSKVT